MLIYESTTTNFDNLGLGSLMPSKCIVTEELNGQYSLSMSHPIDEDGKWEKIQQDRILKVQTHDGDQLFRLYKPVKNSRSGTIEVSALHIFYDLADNLIEDTRPTIKDGQDAGDIILGGCQYSTPFTFSSDITGVTTAYYIRKNPVEAFIGSEDQAFISRWGGEIRRNNFAIEINQRRGADLGMKIAYRKNLTGVELSSDTSGVVTRIIPTALDENGTVFYTDAKYYNSSHIGDYPHPKIGVLNTGIRVGQEVDGSIPYPDVASAKTAMAEMAQAAFDNGADMPDVSVSVTYVNLGDTDEYAAYKDIITKAHMGDDVTLEHPELNIDVKLRVVKIEWDAATNRINSIVLGSQLPNYANTAVSRDIDVSALKNSQPTNLQENGIYNGISVNHTEGFKTIATISGKTITTKQNSYDGFAIYDGATYVGGIKVVDGKVLFIGNAVETTATVSGKTITVKTNPTDGFAIYDGATYVGGVKVINGEVAFIGNVLANADDDTNYVKIGDVSVDGYPFIGICMYDTDISTTVPVIQFLKASAANSLIFKGSGQYPRFQLLENAISMWFNASHGVVVDETGVHNI